MNLALLSFIAILIPSTAIASDYDSVLKQLTRHYYHSLDIDDQMKVYEKRYVPEFVKEYKTPMAIFLRLTIERKITCTWRFP